MGTRTRWLGAAGAVAALAICLALWLEPVDLDTGLHGPDGRNYLSLLHSLLFDRDLLLYNDNVLFAQHVLVTPTGYALELHNIGTALAFLPFYALGHGTCLLAGGSCTGDSLPYYVWLSVGNWAYGLLALVFAWRLAVRHAAPRWASVAVGAVALGSPFFYYWIRFFNPHMPALLLVAALAWIWDATRARRADHHWLLMGALGGLAASIATYNAVFLLLPGLDLLADAWRRRASPLRPGLWLSLGALAGISPQLAAWWLLYGHPLGVPYGQQLFWLDPGLPDLLISSYHGLYFYSPALAVATLGFVPLFRRDRLLALSSLATLAAHVYVSSCNIAWWGGAAFGARYVLSSLPLLALPLAALLSAMRWRGVVYAALVAGIGWSWGLMLADMGRLVDPGQYIPPAWQLWVQARVLAGLPALVQQHLLTPRLVAAPLLALPAALGLAALAWLAGRLRSQAVRGLGVAAVALPLLARAAHPLDGRSQQNPTPIGRRGPGWLPSLTYDLYDLSEGYLQRGAYSLCAGRQSARTGLQTARDIYAARTWVRFHQAGQRHVPNAVDWPVDEACAWWAGRPGQDVILYWRPQVPVLDATYRTEVRFSTPRERPWQRGPAPSRRLALPGRRDCARRLPADGGSRIVRYEPGDHRLSGQRRCRAGTAGGTDRWPAVASSAPRGAVGAGPGGVASSPGSPPGWAPGRWPIPTNSCTAKAWCWNSPGGYGRVSRSTSRWPSSPGHLQLPAPGPGAGEPWLSLAGRWLRRRPRVGPVGRADRGVVLLAWVRSATGQTLPAVGAALTWLGAPYVYHWAPQFRVDLPGWPSVWLGSTWCGGPDLARTDCGRRLFVLGLYCKQSFLAAPTAAVVGLALPAPRQAWTLTGLSLLLGGLPFGGCCSPPGGHSGQHGQRQRQPFDLQRLGAQVRTWCGPTRCWWCSRAFWPLGGACAGQAGPRDGATGRRVEGAPAAVLTDAYLVLALATVALAGKAGSWENYFLEPLAALCLAAGLGLARLRALRTPVHALAPLLVLAQVALMWHAPAEAAKLLRAGAADNRAIQPLVAAAPGLALSEDAGLLVQAGKPVPYYDFQLTQLALAGRWDQSWEVQHLRQGAFDLVIFEYDSRINVEQYGRYTREFMSALDYGYHLAERVGKYRVYRPAPLGRERRVSLEGGLALVGHTLPPARVEPGQALSLEIVWQAAAPPPQAYTSFLHLLDSDGRGWAGDDHPPWEGLYPTNRWAEGEMVRMHYTLPLPAELPAGLYTLQAGWYDSNLTRLRTDSGIDALPLAVVQVAARGEALAGPEGAQVEAAFLSGIYLERYWLAQEPGWLEVGLTWRTEGFLDADWTVFVHLRDAAGKTVAQGDSPPAGGAWPTSLWLPGARVRDVHTVTLPSPALPSGEYELVVGLYNPATGERLPLLLGGDSVSLATVRLP